MQVINCTLFGVIITITTIITFSMIRSILICITDTEFKWFLLFL